jgi:hypothetical protein
MCLPACRLLRISFQQMRRADGLDALHLGAGVHASFCDAAWRCVRALPKHLHLRIRCPISNRPRNSAADTTHLGAPATIAKTVASLMVLSWMGWMWTDFGEAMLSHATRRKRARATEAGSGTDVSSPTKFAVRTFRLLFLLGKTGIFPGQSCNTTAVCFVLSTHIPSSLFLEKPHFLSSCLFPTATPWSTPPSTPWTTPKPSRYSRTSTPSAMGLTSKPSSTPRRTAA